jgi:hypothetical protein
MPENQESPTPKKRRGTKSRLKYEDVAYQIGKNRGNISWSAKALNVSRSALLSFISRHPRLEEMLTDEREALVDNAEIAIGAKIIDGEAWAVIWCLKTMGAKRGWVEPGAEQFRQEIEAIKKQLTEAEAKRANDNQVSE